jgi:membrane fusion protein, multidrug efflux system
MLEPAPPAFDAARTGAADAPVRGGLRDARVGGMVRPSPAAARRIPRTPLCIALACLVGLPAGCAPKRERRAARIPIVVARVERRSVPFEMEATGRVEPIRSADVTAQVTGLITHVGFHEGDEVAAGDALFQVDPRPFQATAERAAAVLERDRAQAETAQLELARAQALASQGLIAAEELDQKRTVSSALWASVRADSAALVSARIDLGNATIRAPIAGRTGSTLVHAGDTVKENETASPVVTINQIRPILARFTLPQTDLPALRRQNGTGLRVDAAPAGTDSTWLEGRLTFIDNRVDPETGTVLLKAEFPNQDRALWPGAFVRIRLRLYDQRDAVVVPAAAVSNSQSGPYCFVVKPDTTVEARPVTIQRAWRDLAVVANGLAPGEIVVTDGQVRLSPGAKAFIRPTGVAPKPASDGP